MINASKLVHEKVEGSSPEIQEEKKIPPFKPLLDKEEETLFKKEESVFDLASPKKTEKEEVIGMVLPPPIVPLSSPLLLGSLEAIRPVAPIFEAMVGSMQIMIDKGIVETKLVLDAPQYANSPFFGTEIIIREYSTAPKIFNIELSAPSQTLMLLEKNRSHLLAAIQGQGYKFRIYRLETLLLDKGKQKEEKNFSENEKEGDAAT